MRIGIVGFGFIGRHLYQRLMQGGEPGLSVAFVWNRSPGKIAGVPLGLVLRDLAEATAKRADLIVEVAHPEVTEMHGVLERPIVQDKLTEMIHLTETMYACGGTARSSSRPRTISSPRSPRWPTTRCAAGWSRPRWRESAACSSRTARWSGSTRSSSSATGSPR